MLTKKAIINNAETFCLFIGYPRSSHTLVGALLDAHPEVVISTEANAIRMFHRGFPKGLILAKLIAKSKWFAKNKAVWTGYSYLVHGQYQGKFTDLKVIGDKKGEQTTALVRKHENGLKTLNSLSGRLGKKIKLIHVIRNPFDNITTLARKGGDSKEREVTSSRLDEAIKRYFLEVQAVKRIKEDCQYEIFDLRNETLIADTQQTLVELCNFLEVEPYVDYIESCSKIVMNSQKRTRETITWTPEKKAKVLSEMKKYDFLSNYTFTN